MTADPPGPLPEAEAAAMTPASAPSSEPQGAKLAIELLPLLAFFATLMMFGLKPATGVLMVATLASLVAARIWLGKIAPMLWLTAALVTFFGTLTFVLGDDRFIKMKPTAASLIMAAIFGIGHLTGRPLLKLMLGDALKLDEAGWRTLTVRWVAFFAVLAGLNEVVWRNFSDSTWGYFKAFGILGLTLVFMMFQVGLIRRHSTDKE